VQVAALKRGVESEEAKARESVTAAQKELGRVQELFDQKLRGQQDLEQAKMRLTHAQEDLAAAADKKKLFDATGVLARHTLAARRAGTVLTVHASPGQFVAAAAPLVTVADLSSVWVRVPVPEFDLPRLDRRQDVTVWLKANGPAPARPGENAWQARPVALVPMVDPGRHTADVVYELPPAASRALFARDQMVNVMVPLGGRSKETVVPYAAVVFDAYGGSWIYLDRTAPGAPERVYERRRVELGPGLGDGVVVRPRCEPGDRVVTRAAAALFSREFYKPPVPTTSSSEAEEDD
jgi:RND family efflux transporter MFP subunit